MKKILVLAASNSSQSINRALVRHAAERLKAEYLPDAELEFLDLRDFEMPLYSADREEESGIPRQAQAFFAQIGEADALMISYAEHNGAYSAAFKNLFDWASRIQTKIFQNKPMLALSTSPGAGGAARVLKFATDSAPVFGANIVASLSVPRFPENFDTSTGQLSNSELSDTLGQHLRSFAEQLS